MLLAHFLSHFSFSFFKKDLYKNQTQEDIGKHFKKESICTFGFSSNDTFSETDKQDNLIFLFKQFGQSFVGYQGYNKTKQSQVLFSKACTVSNEAYGRLTIERCWNQWTAFASAKTTDKSSPAVALYTSNKTNKKYTGWTKEGLDRFGELAILVKGERKTELRKDTEMKYMKDRQAKYSNNEKNTPKSISMSCVTDIYTELGNSDSDDDSDDNSDENSKKGDKDSQKQTHYNDSDLESVTSSDNNTYTQVYSHGSDDSKSK